ncbi:CLUMA_CG004961, isoform A [Clunio marinus]|uniref:CLUMA_CG004961, isoform A n=1 Tax=Clunio marinus TaxID=568069 RepID=A0A1J1HTG4_9DIPT|nr:CLUMA_CG004961, isoform A [Clunio marinus]
MFDKRKKTQSKNHFTISFYYVFMMKSDLIIINSINYAVLRMMYEKSHAPKTSNMKRWKKSKINKKDEILSQHNSSSSPSSSKFLSEAGCNSFKNCTKQLTIALKFSM